MSVKDEIRDWKNQKITRLFRQACLERIEEIKEDLINSAGDSPLTDAFKRGVVWGYREALEFDIEEEDIEEDTIQ